MGSMKYFIFGISIGLMVTACAGVVWPYKFYHLSGNNFSGTLLGPKETDDIAFSECRPVNGKQRCVVVFYTELQKLVTDYKQTKQALYDCQRGGR